MSTSTEHCSQDKGYLLDVFGDRRSSVYLTLGLHYRWSRLANEVLTSLLPRHVAMALAKNSVALVVG
jgi:hypothetical protein